MNLHEEYAKAYREYVEAVRYSSRIYTSYALSTGEGAKLLYQDYVENEKRIREIAHRAAELDRIRHQS